MAIRGETVATMTDDSVFEALIYGREAAFSRARQTSQRSAPETHLRAIRFEREHDKNTQRTSTVHRMIDFNLKVFIDIECAAAVHRNTQPFSPSK